MGEHEEPHTFLIFLCELKAQHLRPKLLCPLWQIAFSRFTYSPFTPSLFTVHRSPITAFQMDIAKQAEMFANRIAKNYRHLRKWANREGIDCFRVYDRDIPELPFALDVYLDRALLHEYSRPFDDTPEQGEWLSAMTSAAAAALELEPERLILKERHGQRPTEQYRRTTKPSTEFSVREGGCRFLVNLGEYLDTGLFLDHRPTRALVREAAHGKRFLNLFSYTGSFTVYAAAGGAISSVSVDLSKTYLEWAKRNFSLNKLNLSNHRLVHANVTVFLAEEKSRGNRYGLIVLDPPSFSNSKRMDDVLDIQRDHAHLIRDAAALLEPGGELFFSTNLRSFRIDADALSGLRLVDISEQTIPPDFRNRRIHRCWRIAVVTPD
jgi:23S rRNA (cytosine1962-C5)-methyltransferase